MNDVKKSNLKVATFNIAHARGRGLHQVLTSHNNLQRNLEEIGNFINSEQPDLLALQEIDFSCTWTHMKDQCEFLLNHCKEHPFSVKGTHTNNRVLKYGTAILSKTEFDQARAQTFKANTRLALKGFTSALLNWPQEPEFKFLFISLHLDFMGPLKRAAQLSELTKFLKTSELPYVLAGDFNCDLSSSGNKLMSILNEVAPQTIVQKTKLVTFPRLRRQLDWIIPSQHFVIESQKTGPANLSDHLPLIAILSRND